ncbi:MAG: S24 family peptidase [Bacteroidaceae bacterium]|nr:S24 family peptidase [Bacteroidaceae bacterium]
MKISIKNQEVCENCMNRTCAFVDVRIKEQFYSLRTETTVCPTGVLESETKPASFGRDCVHCALCSMNCHANNLEVTDDGQSLDLSGLSEFQINAIALSYLDQIVEFAANTNRNRSMNFDGFMQTRAGEACFVEVDYGNDSLECCRRLVGDFITYEGNIGPIRKGVMITREYPREGSRDVFNVIEKLSSFPTTKDCEIYFCTFDTLLQIALNSDTIDWKLSDLFYNPNVEDLVTYLDRIENHKKQDDQDDFVVLNTPEIPVSERFTRFLPLYDIAIACGALVDEGIQSLGNNDVDMEGWIDVSDYGFKPNEQMFIVHAKGESMLPKIHPGDLCVFELYGALGNAGSREGQIVLARQHGKDNDYNCQYTIKLYHSEKNPRTGSNIKIELRPLNQDPQYKVIDVEEEDGEVRIIATLKRVLNKV